MHPLSLAAYRSKDLDQSTVDRIKSEGKLVDVALLKGTTDKAIEWHGKLYYFNYAA